MDQPMINNTFNYIDIAEPTQRPISIELPSKIQNPNLIQKQDQQNFLIKLMIVLVIQSFFELLIGLICWKSQTVSDMNLSYTIPLFIIFLCIYLALLYITRYRPIIWKFKIKEFFLLFFYTSIAIITFSLFAIRLFENTILNQGVLLFLLCNSQAYLQMLVSFIIEKRPSLISTLCQQMIFALIMTIIFIVLQVQEKTCKFNVCPGSNFVMIIFTIFMFILYLGFIASQTISLFEILNGKFGLRSDQYFVAAILLQYSTLLPFSSAS